MKAVVFHKVGDIRLEEVQEPRMEVPTDAIVRLTASAICGTDLHFVRGTVSGLKPGTILGHEGVGVVEATGPSVKEIKVGDRVVVCSTIACGTCERCRAEDFSQCANANPTLGIIGVYPPQIDAFPIGEAMNKNLSLKMGNCPHRRIILKLIELVRTGKADPAKVITHQGKLTSAIAAYQAFDQREEGWIKVELDPEARTRQVA